MFGSLIAMMIYGKQDFGKAFGWYALTALSSFLLIAFMPYFLLTPVGLIMWTLIRYLIGRGFVKGFLKENPANIGGKDGTSYFNLFMLGIVFDIIIVIVLFTAIGLNANAIVAWIQNIG